MDVEEVINTLELWKTFPSRSVYCNETAYQFIEVSIRAIQQTIDLLKK